MLIRIGVGGNLLFLGCGYGRKVAPLLYQCTSSGWLSRQTLTRPEESSRQVETRYKLVESFSDFKTVDGLQMPYHWNIRLTTEARDTSIWEWDMLFARIVQNQPTDPKIFRWLFVQGEPRSAEPGRARGSEF
ncbi:MAG TPA: hypothetical protein VI699_02295 [Candidatus Acidoferrales bacterium]|nr:hypothetical protein [Candidatus Acidoferrales bacterium]